MAEVTTHVEKVTMTSNQQTREEILVQDDQLVDDDSILTLREKLHSNEFSDALKALETAHHRILDGKYLLDRIQTYQC
jgi:Mn-containing catalase